MTSRFFIENRKNTITSNRPLDLMIGYLPAIQYI
jgi:raw score 9.42